MTVMANTAAVAPLADDAMRATALSEHGRSLLVEAGAGSGKTALLAGRVALLLAIGVKPRNVAAVTFTELAAGELMQRVRAFAMALHAGGVPPELRVALPKGISRSQRDHLALALDALDEMVCATIHGFCQRVATPYPVEAGIDPGASVIDARQADQMFDDLLEHWLWQILDSEAGGMLADLVVQDADRAVALVRQVAGQMRRRRDAIVPPAGDLTLAAGTMSAAVAGYAACLDRTGVNDIATAAAVAAFSRMADSLASGITPGRVVSLAADSVLCTAKGEFAKWRNAGKWKDSAKVAGISTNDARAMYETLLGHHEQCCDAWRALKSMAAGCVLFAVAESVRPLLDAFATAKRNAAVLDFDDLIYAARDLLRDHESVRKALAQRYTHVLVDEFQDTDALQSEILWRLCGENADVSADEWRTRHIRPGALFLVGDPKQAIYRFRGADIAAYTAAREAFARQDESSVLSISTNFRSLAPVLEYVNDCFQAALSLPSQPGFTPLQAFLPARDANPCVVALDIVLPAGDAGQGADAFRDAEADAVADLCHTLINTVMVAERGGGALRPCRAADIALLAPSGGGLWRYEAALEQRGIAVASQAGKSFYLRQEVQDLVALTRTLADTRDTIALGALLRGPLVGLTEEELLDIVLRLPHVDGAVTLPRLSLHIDIEQVHHPVAREVLAALQELRRRADSTTPVLLLSDALEVLRVRQILQQRERHHAARALANVDRFLDMSRAYALQGLGAFASAVSTAWADQARVSEGLADSREDAVTLYTMHAAKGLEWPVVIPVNTMTRVQSAEQVFVANDSGQLHCPVFGAVPACHEEARERENTQLEHERVRLWYVAATRARELLVLPRSAVAPGANAWANQLDLRHMALPHFAPGSGLTTASSSTGADERAVVSVSGVQTAGMFAAEQLRIDASSRSVEWLTPSRNEGVSDGFAPQDGVDPGDAASLVQGGLARGRVLHKLMEEVLTGETADALAALSERAAQLVGELGQCVVEDAAQGLSSAELAATVVATLSLPEIVALRPGLVPEYPVWHCEGMPGRESAEAGIVDAMTFDDGGRPRVVVDWKSDVAPTAGQVAHYRTQVASYLRITGAELGLVVLMTSGTVISVSSMGG